MIWKMAYKPILSTKNGIVSPFFSTFYFEITINPQEATKKSTGRYHATFTPLPPILIVVQYQNQETALGTIHGVFSDFTIYTCIFFCVCVCVYVVLFNYVTYVAFVTSSNKTQKCSICTRLLHATFYSYSHSPNP